MKKLMLVITTLSMLVASAGVYADDCESDLADTFRDLKDSMRVIKRVVHGSDNEALVSEVDKAVALVRKAGQQKPMIYAELSGKRLEEAKDYYAKAIDKLETYLLSLKQASSDEVDDVLDDIKSLEKESHDKLKEC